MMDFSVSHIGGDAAWEGITVAEQIAIVLFTSEHQDTVNISIDLDT